MTALFQLSMAIALMTFVGCDQPQTGKPKDPVVNRPIEKAPEKPADPVVNRPIEKAPEKPADPVVNTPIGKAPAKPVDPVIPSEEKNAWSGDGKYPTANTALSVAFTGRVIHVVLKGEIPIRAVTVRSLFLDQSQIKVFGNSTFVIGRSVLHGKEVWVPLSDVSAIEVFADFSEWLAVYGKIIPAKPVEPLVHPREVK
jgi:hypothetical protein